MAPPKRVVRQAAAASAAAKAATATSAASIGQEASSGGASTPASPSTSSLTSFADTKAVFTDALKSYSSDTPRRLKLVDAFLVFLVAVGVLQFVYCVLIGNYPFNAFLAGFSITVGQFVLVAALRVQVNPKNSSEFEKVSPERAFADFVFGSLILHFFTYNFIN